MADASPNNLSADSGNDLKTGAHHIKDKTCLYCHQAFTSSSLGRHLDLFIRDRNPKHPDGIHDVAAIRRMRDVVTRRQSRSSYATFTSHGSVRPASMPAPPAASGPVLSFASEDGMSPRGCKRKLDHSDSGLPSSSLPHSAALVRRPVEPTGSNSTHQPPPRSRLELELELRDAVETAQAAQLAIRELLVPSIYSHFATPFDFDPLSFDFPALTLRCLSHPPTIFSSTPIPASSSWFTTPPSTREFDALSTYIQDAFRRWTSSSPRRATYNGDFGPRTSSGCAAGSRQSPQNLLHQILTEHKVLGHLRSIFNAWRSIPQQRREALWILELARTSGRSRSEAEKLQDHNNRLQRENETLKAQLRRFNAGQHSNKQEAQKVLTHDHEATANQPVQYHQDQDLDALVVASVCRWRPFIAPSFNGDMSIAAATSPARTGDNAPSEDGSMTTFISPNPHLPSSRRPLPIPSNGSVIVHNPSSNALGVQDDDDEDDEDVDVDSEMEVDVEVNTDADSDSDVVMLATAVGRGSTGNPQKSLAKGISRPLPQAGAVQTGSTPWTEPNGHPVGAVLASNMGISLPVGDPIFMAQ